MKYLPFREAKSFVQKLGLKSSQEWNEYCNSGKKPASIPRGVARIYGSNWKGWGDWLGTVTLVERTFRPYQEAKVYTKSLGLQNRNQWRSFARNNKLPIDVPTNPEGTYKREWKGWGDWLGTGNVRNADRNFRAFEEARAYVHSLDLKNKGDWASYSKSEDRPPDIPALPPRTYQKLWKDWGDWLGTGADKC